MGYLSEGGLHVASWTYAAIGAVVLILYGINPNMQPAHFGRVYAAYGGMFIVLSLLWGWGIRRSSAGSL